jgi:uncharacterized protein VirK/YbjX
MPYTDFVIREKVERKSINKYSYTKRSQGRPKYRLEDNIKQDICQMKIKNWIA